MSGNCANPLYLQWIREWWDTANANNAKDRLTYKKAWESMKAHTVEIAHPSEAIKLNGIGPKLVERLTERLETYCQDEGLEMPKRPTKKRAKNGNARDGEGDDDDQEASPPKRARKAPKGYVPKPRSGAYALLLTLAELPEGQTVGLTKAELQDQAQPLADASFKVAPDPSKFHTAWNSMGTLESKHLVYTFGKPHKKYALTEEGWAIAKSMKLTEQSGHASPSRELPEPGSSSRPPLRETSSSRNRITIDLDDDDNNATIDDFEERIKRKFDSKENFMKIMAESMFGTTNSLDDQALSLISEFASRAKSAKPIASARPAPTNNAESRTAPLSRPGRVATNPTTLPGRTPSNTIPQAAGSSTAIQQSALRPTTPVMPAASDIPQYQPIIIRPGCFTVELVLDTREVRAKTDRNYIQDELNKAGLRCEQRALQIGDMIWVAKIQDQAVINQLELSDRKVPEIVLDYVVERKRLDDLDASIKDKRFLEQKFRLKRSGIQNAIYIVEDYGSIQAMEDQQHTRMMTAIAATQVIDGFFVKRTRKLDDTIAYLANMTRLLKEKYEDKSLVVIPSSVLSPQNHLVLRAPQPMTGARHYITYEALAALASKSATLTARDIFLKMLMCTRGITGDKAIEIQKRWHTPRHFIEAYETRPAAAKRNEMIWEVAGSYQDRRKIGKAVSQTLAEIWGSV